jgi:hypothetical protein
VPLTREQLEFVAKVQHNTISILLDQLAEAQRQLAEVARDEWENGRLAAHREHAEWFALVSRLVRQRAGEPSHAERAAAERERVKPREGDFMGRLSREQYFGTDAPRLAAMERRAA